jgi:predicted metalloprotease with PDZ domain
VSYYLKGAVVALCLDLQLRRDGASLPLVLQQLWSSHGRWGRGYSEADLIQAFALHSPALATQLPAWLDGVDDPDLDGYLCDVGLRLEAEMASTPWAGLSLQMKDGSLVAQRVWRDGPAEQAGVMVGDEVLALAGQRLRQPAQLAEALQADAPQRLLICRRSQVLSLRLQAQPPGVERYRLVAQASINAQQREAQRRWLTLDNGRDGTPTATALATP